MHVMKRPLFVKRIKNKPRIKRATETQIHRVKKEKPQIKAISKASYFAILRIATIQSKLFKSHVTGLN